jgi:hypothetical protein
MVTTGVLNSSDHVELIEGDILNRRRLLHGMPV